VQHLKYAAFSTQNSKSLYCIHSDT